MTRWVGLAAVLLAACSGVLPQYATSVVPAPDLERPLIDARRCLETIGFDLKIMDVEAGLISGETFELTHDRTATVVVTEVSVFSGADSMRIIAHSRRATPASDGWESVRTSERVQRAVDRMAKRLAGGSSPTGAPCAPDLVPPVDELALEAGPHTTPWSPGTGR